MRLNRYLASAGLGSRRGVETLIKEGRVKINGVVITDLSTQVSPQDVVKVGQKVVRAQQSLYVLLNKPKGYMVTASDERDRKTVYECLPPEWPRVFHVGRLDRESEGLLLLTNDGDLSLALTHPRYKIDKEYEVLLDRPFDPAHREKLLKGFHIIGGRAKMESVKAPGGKKITVILRQGIKRQIRLMLYELGYEVEQLRRVRIGTLHLGGMRPGEWRLLNKKEVEALRQGAPASAPSAPPPERVSSGDR